MTNNGIYIGGVDVPVESLDCIQRNRLGSNIDLVGCYVCGVNGTSERPLRYSNFRIFDDYTNDENIKIRVGTKVVQLFEQNGFRAMLDVESKFWVYVLIGACPDHLLNLKKLIDSTMEGGVLSLELITQSLDITEEEKNKVYDLDWETMRSRGMV